MEYITKKQCIETKGRFEKYRAQTPLISPKHNPGRMAEGMLDLFARCKRANIYLQKITIEISKATEVEYIIFRGKWGAKFRMAFPNW